MLKRNGCSRSALRMLAMATRLMPVLLVARGAKLLAAAAVYTGAGDGVNWSNSANWTTGGVAGVLPSDVSPGDDITFNAGNATIVQLDTNRFANSLNFQSVATTVDAPPTGENILTLGTGNIFFNVYNGSNNVIRTATIYSDLVSAQALTITNANSLSYYNSYGPTLSLQGAYNNLSNGATIGSASLGGQATLMFGYPGTFQGSGGSISLDGNLIYTGVGATAVINQPIGPVPGSFAFIMNVSGSSLVLNGAITEPLNLGTDPSQQITIAGTTPNTGGLEVYSTTTFNKSAGVAAAAGNVQIEPGASVNMLASNQLGPTTSVGFEATNSILSINNTYQAISRLNGVGVVNLGSGGTLSINLPGSFIGYSLANFNGSGTIIKAGTATLSLNGTGAYYGSTSFTGIMNVSGGTLQLGPSPIFTPSVYTVANLASVDLDGNSISGNGGSGAMTLNGTGATYSGALTNTSLTTATAGGPITLASNTTIGGAGGIILTGTVSGPGGLTNSNYSTLTILGLSSFTGGLTVPGGTINMSSGTYSGGIALTGGTLAVNDDTGLGATSNTVSFSNGGTLQANGSFTTARSFQSSGGHFSIASGATVIDNGTFTGTGNFTLAGAGTWRLTNSNPFAGSLALAGGTLSLSGTNGAMTALTSIDLITTGVLELNSSTALGGNQTLQNRVGDSVPITLDGGTISIIGADGQTTTETLGPLISGIGASTISLTNGSGTGSAVTLTFSSLGAANSGATIGFIGSDLGNSQKIFFNSGVSDGAVLGGGATVNGTDFAKYSATQGVIPFSRSDYSINVFNPGTNVKLDPQVTTPPVPGDVGTVSIKTLNIAADIADVAVNQDAGTTLTITNGGLLVSGTHNATISGGTLNSSSGELDISVQTGQLSISSALAGSFVLTKRGAGTLALTGSAASTYTGFTLVSGEMDLNKSAGAIAIPGNLLVDGGLLKSLASNQIAPSANVTLNYGTWDLNGQTESINTLNNLNGVMLFHGGVLNVANGVNLAGGVTTVASNLSSSALITVTGGDNEIRSHGNVSTQAIAFIGDATPTISIYSDTVSPGQLILPNNANLSFTGDAGATANLLSVGNSTYPGAINLSGSVNHTVTVSPGSTMVISAQLMNGGFNLSGGGTLDLQAQASSSLGTINVSPNTTLQLLKANEVGATPSVVQLTGGTLDLRSDGVTEYYSGIIGVTTGTIDLDVLTPVIGATAGTFYSDGINLASGNNSLTVTGKDGGTFQPGTLTLFYNASSPGPATLHTVANLTISTITVQSSAVDLVKDQAGTLTLIGYGSNSYGNTTINGGSLLLDKTYGLAIPNNLSIFAGSTVQLLAANQISPTAAITINAATGPSLLDLNGFNNSFGSVAFVAGGTLSTGTGLATLTGNVSFNGSSGTALISGNLNLSGGQPTFSVARGTSAVDLQVSAVINGNAGLTKTGNGILYLSGTNSFTGTVFILAGTLQVDSDANLGAASNLIALQGGSLQSSSSLTHQLEFVGGSTLNASAGALTLSAAPYWFGSLTLSKGTLNLNVNSGNVYLSPGNSLTISPGATVVDEGAIDALSTSSTTAVNIVNNSGFFDVTQGIKAAGTISGSGNTNVAGGVSFTAASIRQNALIANGTITIANEAVRNASNGVSVLSSLSIAGVTNAWTGKLDLTDNDLIVHNGDLTGITNQIKSGYNAGRWNGTGGITSSAAAGSTTHLMALGVIPNINSNSTPVFSTFDGQSAVSTDVLVRYTYVGDCTLDGKVDGSDYSRIDAAYLADKTNPSAMTGWFNGDFNYDGVINGSDYTLIDNTFNSQGAIINAALASPAVKIAAEIAAGSSPGSSPVPEPACGVLLMVVSMSTLSRRRNTRV